MNIYLNSFFGDEFIGDLEMELLKDNLRKEGNVVECKCGNMLEVISGKVDYKQKDDDGKVLSRQAAENMAKHRIRCNNCNCVFCSQCNTEPYHIGKT